MRSVGNAYLRLRLPLRVCWFTYETVATHRVERDRDRIASRCRLLVAKRHSSSTVPSIPSFCASAVRHLELASRLDERVVDHLREHLLVAGAQDDLRAARQHGMRHAERLGREHLAARRALRVARCAARPREGDVPAGGRGSARQRGRTGIRPALRDDRHRTDGREERDSAEHGESLREDARHGD